MEFIDSFFIDPLIGKFIYPDKVATALSGGCDSMALTLLMNEWCKKHSINLTALIVDHKLRSESTIEANEVKNKMDNLGIDCKILTYKGIIPKSNIEEIARNYRYDLIINFCKTNKINFVAMGHNKNEQIETFLLNLIRGSGVYGLCGIPETIKKDGVTFFRPLLNHSKDDLKNICKQYNQTWVEDPSNQDDKYLRVRVRKLHDTFLSLGLNDDRICKTIENMKTAREAINSSVHIMLGKCLINKFDKLKIIEIDLNVLLSAPDEIIYRVLEKYMCWFSDAEHSHIRSDILRNIIYNLKISLKTKIFNVKMAAGNKLKLININGKSVLQIAKV